MEELSHTPTENFIPKNYEALSKLPGELPQHQQGEIRELFGAIQQNEAQLKIFNRLFTTFKASSLRIHLEDEGISLEEQTRLLSNEYSLKLVDILARSEHAFDYRGQLAIMTAGIPFDKLPASLKETFDVEDRSDAAIVLPFHPTEHTFICSEGLPFLNISISASNPKYYDPNYNALAVNDSLIYKRRGKYAALCARSTSNKNGTFIEGVWYAPLEEETGKNLEQNARTGKISLPNDDAWIVVQPYIYSTNFNSSTGLYDREDKKETLLDLRTKPDVKNS